MHIFPIPGLVVEAPSAVSESLASLTGMLDPRAVQHREGILYAVMHGDIYGLGDVYLEHGKLQAFSYKGRGYRVTGIDQTIHDIEQHTILVDGTAVDFTESGDTESFIVAIWENHEGTMQGVILGGSALEKSAPVAEE